MSSGHRDSRVDVRVSVPDTVVNQASVESRLRILLAEDEPQIRNLLARVLAREGWDVTAVNDGRQAVAAWPPEGHSYDLIIMDVNMPDMDGYEASCHLKRLHPQAEFLFISGHLDQPLCRKLVQMGFELVPKPFSPQQFAHRVSERLRQSVKSE
ncbi:MAG TPA: response regulator [Chloroflexi bacterium]|jgi:CheY-like chemotaxis protein|nr:response regulator [Chloroflexota bacterium]